MLMVLKEGLQLHCVSFCCFFLVCLSGRSVFHVYYI